MSDGCKTTKQSLVNVTVPSAEMAQEHHLPTTVIAPISSLDSQSSSLPPSSVTLNVNIPFQNDPNVALPSSSLTTETDREMAERLQRELNDRGDGPSVFSLFCAWR